MPISRVGHSLELSDIRVFLSFSLCRQQDDNLHPHLAGCDEDAVAAFARCLLNSEFVIVLTSTVLEHRRFSKQVSFFQGWLDADLQHVL